MISWALMSAIRKAVIPAAGWGTRFLPATKSVPKELLPIVDKPILLFIVEEAVAAGINEIILVVSDTKKDIENFFLPNPGLEAVLKKAKNTAALELQNYLQTLAKITCVVQHQALGLGHAVLTAREAVGNEPFAVMLGDEIMLSRPGKSSGVGQLVDLFNETKTSAVAVMEVAASEVSKYGIISGQARNSTSWTVDNVVEKPNVNEAPSRLALPGRYVFVPEIFAHLSQVQPGRNGEIQLTDGMVALAKKEGLIASLIDAERFDAGDKLGFVQANVELALNHPEIGIAFRSYLKQRSKEL
jgi:UTP--glucose-1-phosphate uridylyltransferase